MKKNQEAREIEAIEAIEVMEMFGVSLDAADLSRLEELNDLYLELEQIYIHRGKHTSKAAEFGAKICRFEFTDFSEHELNQRINLVNKYKKTVSKRDNNSLRMFEAEERISVLNVLLDHIPEELLKKKCYSFDLRVKK